MAEKKKLSVAEILAAARKADSGKAEGGKPAEEPAAAEPAAEEAAAPAAETPEKKAPAAPKAKPAPVAKPGGAGRPSVADILAAARGGGASGGAAPAPKKEAPAPKPAAAKAAPKPAEKAKPAEKPAKAPAAAVATAEKDTASILAAARKEVKPGPMSKAEAAAKAKDSPAPPKEPKSKLVVPPMPTKPAYAKPKAAKEKAGEGEDRRFFLGVLFGSFLGVGFTAMTGTFVAWTLGFARFMFPNILTEPPSRFKVGFPNDFPPGSVEEKFKALFGVWIVNTEYNGKREIVALRTVCTHLGCTPNWLEGEQKFKCPCHGSGFYKDGINFEGPAPRPLERYAIALADDGQLEVDKSKLFQEELGQWNDSASYVSV